MPEAVNPVSISTAASYRSRRGQAVSLPTGEVWLLRRVLLQDLMSRGMIPDQLSPIVEEMIGRIAPDGRREVSQEEQDQINAEISAKVETMAKIEQMRLMTELYNQFVIAAAIQPRVFGTVEEAEKNDGLCVDEVDFSDKQFIFEWTQGGLEALEAAKSDSQESSAPVDNTSKGSKVRPKAVRTA